MPTISVDKEDLFLALGRRYSNDDFQDLCFDFGIELDGDTTDECERAGGNGNGERPRFKIDVPANRYDLVCFEGIARALNIFTGRLQTAPAYTLEPARTSVRIRPETAQVRPFACAAILRDIRLDERSYASFIDLQDKLHQNLCRMRRFVAIGTHDLDNLTLPLTYEARDPKDITFVPLNQTAKVDGHGVMKLYEHDRHLGKYLYLIKDSPVFPVFYDAKQTVLSLPPIINSDATKITLSTRNILIECTATDKTKMQVALNILVAIFSQYCSPAFSVEAVDIHYPDGHCETTPDLRARQMTASRGYINSCLGLELDNAKICHFLKRMSLDAQQTGEDDTLLINVPVSRPDILHQCDIMEDVGIAYGFNSLKRTFPTSSTVGAPLPLNKLSDIIRREAVASGWIEVLSLILCSHDENFAWCRKRDEGNAIHLANPMTIEYQVVRTNLLQGLLKTLRENKKEPLPLRVFEVSDTAVKDVSLERRARNERHFCAIYQNRSGGFEVIQGLLDRVMAMLDVKHVAPHSREHGYYLEAIEDPTYLDKRAAAIHYRFDRSKSSHMDARDPDALPSDIEQADGSTQPPGLVERVKDLTLSSEVDLVIGSIGLLHPMVLYRFDLEFPCSALEMTIEPFL